MNAHVTVQVRDTLNRRVATLETALASTKPGAMIFAWSSFGIGVLIATDGPRVVGVEQATPVRASDRRAFCNGANVPASIVDRADALRAALAITRGLLSQIDQLAA